MTNVNTGERDSRSAQKGQKGGAVGSPTLPVKVAPMFRRIDWLTLGVTFIVVWTVYFLTLAPELTLEDSGELVTGSFYAGIPHPPGYPVWTIYSWLWTVLIPWGNPAWRVALAEAFLGALACGLLSILVSRGSSMLMESIEELKSMTGKWENAICMIAGFVAGLLMGLDGFMWRESVAVNRIAVSSVPWFLVVLLCIMRWLYAPHQFRFIYAALFVFGICFTTHQSLIVAALGVQIAIAAGSHRLGRDVFFGNFVIYTLCVCYQIFTGQPVFANLSKPGLVIIFHGVGIGSLLASCWLMIKTKGFLSEWLHVTILGALWVLGASFYFYMPVSGMTNPPMQWGYPRTVEGFFHALSRGQYEQPNPTDVISDPKRFFGQLGMMVSGVADEYTWVFMFIALVPFVFFFRMQRRERAWLIGLTGIYLCLGVLLMILLNPNTDRASADLIKVFFNNSHTIVAALIGYGLAVTAAFMSTNYEKFRLWGLGGGVVAVLLALFSLLEATGRHFGGPAGEISLFELPHWIGVAMGKNQYGLPIFGKLVLVAIPLAFVFTLVLYRRRGPLLITLGLFLLMPLHSGLSHWFRSDQHKHWFGYWFGHDMFTPPFKGADGKPIYPEMTKDAVLYGGTDPGRFCPTYMVFCESFTPHNCQPEQDQTFDRRDVYIITQNALADGTYLNYIRAHYNRSKQIDPPFFQELLRSTKEKEQGYKTNLVAQLVSPLDTIFERHGAKVERQRRTFTSWFVDKDFLDLGSLAGKLRPGPNQDAVSKFLYDHLTSQTKQLLAGSGNDAALRRALAADLNVILQRELKAKEAAEAKQREKAGVDQRISDGDSSQSLARKQETLTKELAELVKIEPLYQPERFGQVTVSEYLQDFISENPQSDTRIRLNRLLLEAAYPKEIAKSLGGVYPDREIYIATPDDSSKCFNEYLSEAQKRLQHDMQFPNDPKQIRPGEDVKVVENRVTVAGQVAVMAINGLLTKVMFDHNPKNEFFVEESFPLDWMYPHLTPYGIIMKINRQPLSSLTEDVLQRDHEFWKQYSHRLTGDVVEYDTPLTNITAWIQKTYVRHNFNGFTGDRKFIHDDDAQKAFSKLRSSIGGVYAWRLSPQCPPAYRPKSDAEFTRVLREAEYTFRQALAFCPYSPEAVFRYVNLLLQFNRIDEALIIAQTCLELDPYNGQVVGLVENLKSFRAQRGAMIPPPASDTQLLEAELHKNPSNTQVAVELARTYLQAQQPSRTLQLLDSVISNPAADPASVIRAAQLFAQIADWPRLEGSLEKLVKISPDSPEAWYDLSAFKANLRKNQESLPALAQALALSAKRLQKDPKARDLLSDARTDERFGPLRQTPEFQKLVPPK